MGSDVPLSKLSGTFWIIQLWLLSYLLELADSPQVSIDNVFGRSSLPRTPITPFVTMALKAVSSRPTPPSRKRESAPLSHNFLHPKRSKHQLRVPVEVSDISDTDPRTPSGVDTSFIGSTSSEGYSRIGEEA
ncbi:hypothetical protein GH714_035019 [Hevea brasiliensis]|uniref:DUF4005 domain-containing protein n=1 Tax=Hevea brasiliensis TaxID=3981 RepID=A0A6A6N4V3_HEVBR|nr:hypothetical protein GH714_035019 [Hevea brasiliensis]